MNSDMPATHFWTAVQSPHHWLMLLLTLVITGLAITVHYEVLERISTYLPHLKVRNRVRVLIAILFILGAHVIEIWLYGLGLFLSSFNTGLGVVTGIQGLGFLDAVYLSAATFTTVGYGDLTPTGPLRFLMGCEALVGFVLITWSASFSYLEMQRYWKVR